MPDLFRYSAFGLSIHSELELPELPVGDGEAELTIRLGVPARSRIDATHTEEFAFTRGLAAFYIRDGREIGVDPLPGADMATVRSVLLGKIMAFLMRQRGWLPLHASAVVIGENAVAFSGISTAGKSTTAAAFYARGHSVIADDLSSLRLSSLPVTGERQVLVRPAWPALHLEESQGILEGTAAVGERTDGKCTFAVTRLLCRNEYPVRGIFFLKEGAALRMESIPKAEAAVLLDQHCFMKRSRMRPEVIALQLERCVAIAQATPVHWLIRPRDLSLLPALTALVEAHVAGNS